MSAPGQEPKKSREAEPATVSDNELRPAPPRRDIIPIPLIIGIFTVVLALTAWLLHDNWKRDMTRYQSIRAQQTGNYDTAVKKLKELIEYGESDNDTLMSKSPTYFSEIGYSYSKLNDFDNSLKYYRLAQENRANMGTDDQGGARPAPDFSNMIGYVLMKKGQLDEATTALEAALQFNKLDPVANFSLGEIAMLRGDYIKAADYFKVVANDPVYQEPVKKYYAQIEEKLFAGI